MCTLAWLGNSYPLSMINIAIEMAIEIVDFPKENCDFLIENGDFPIVILVYRRVVVALITWLLRVSWMLPDRMQAAATTPEESLRHIEELEAAWLCCVICDDL